MLGTLPAIVCLGLQACLRQHLMPAFRLLGASSFISINLEGSPWHTGPLGSQYLWPHISSSFLSPHHLFLSLAKQLLLHIQTTASLVQDLSPLGHSLCWEILLYSPAEL